MIIKGVIMVETVTGSKDAGFNVSLALSGAQEHIAATASLDHPLGDIVVLVLNPVSGKISSVSIPLKMSLYLVFDIMQVGIYGQ